MADKKISVEEMDASIIDEEHFTPKVKKQILIACLLALTIGNMMILNVVTLLPGYISNNPNISSLGETDTALIMAMFSVA